MASEETIVKGDNTPVLKNKLIEDIQLKTFVIGVGNAGNQAVVQAHKEGLNSFAVNTSAKDLDDQVVDQSIPSFIVGKEARGSGKNVEKGVMLWKQNGKELFTTKSFMDSCQESDIIVVVSATGGGTGPSVAPEICKALVKIFKNKIIIYHGITPKNSDSNLAFSNTMYCLNKIKELDIPYMLTDLNFFADEDNDIAFAKADAHAVECIKAISGKYMNMSSSQMMDENDIKSVISEPGYLAVYAENHITTAQLEKKTMQQMIIDRIRKGPSMMIQKDGISMQMGVCINTPDDMQEVSRTGNYEEIYSFIGHKPKNGIYENYGVTNGTDAQIVVILSGMTFPINRVSYYSEAVKEQNEFLKKQKDIDTSIDAELVQQLVSNDSCKLTSDTEASAEEIAAALDDLFD